ncbi:MAG: hypothetical protein MJ062_03290 [Oscillospiraceae bacterium]|nr:hypothetical protein [Oscillospiraceae bacterium]
MAGGYDGSLRFNTKIDEDGFLRTVKDVERSLTALEQTVGKLTKVMQAGFSQASTGAEQAAADVAKLSDAADTAAENFSQLPDSETVRVQAETHGITEAQTALDSIPDEQVTVSAMPEGVESVQAALDSIPDEEVRIIPDVEWNGADFETVEIPAELDVDTADFSSAYDTSIEQVKSKFGSLRDSLRGFGSQAAAPSERAGRTIGDSISRGIEKSNPLGTLKSMLKRAAGLAASFFGVRALVSFGKQAVELASDIDEVQNVVDTAFGDMAYKMEDFAAVSVKQFGISRLTAKRTGSTYMAMAHGMGVASDTASDMAVSLTGLSADFASFYNVKQDVAATALNSVFTGETETLKKFGIVMTETNLQQFALTKGIKKSVSAMTQAEKVQLRYAYVMEQGNLAVGDFAKTSGGWANQVRILQEQWKEFGAQVGFVLKNVFLPVVRRVNAVLSSMISAVQAAKEKLSDLFGWESSASSASASVVAVADSYDEVTDSAEEAAAAMDKTLTSYDEIHKLGEDTADTQPEVGTVGGEIAAVSPYIAESDTGADAIDKLSSKWGTKGQQTIDAILISWGQVKGLVDAVRDSFETVFENGTGVETLNLIHGIFLAIIGTIGALAESLRRAWEENEVGVQIVQTVINIINAMLQTVKRFFERLKKWAEETNFYPLLASFQHLLAVVKEVMDEIEEAVLWVFDNIIAPIATWAIETGIPLTLDAISAALDALKTIWEKCKPILLDVFWEKFLKPLGKFTLGSAEKALGLLKDFFQYIADNFDEADARVLLTVAGGVAAIAAAAKGYQIIMSGAAALKSLIAVLAGGATLSAGTVGIAVATFLASYTAARAALRALNIDTEEWGETLYSALHDENGKFSVGVWWDNWKAGAHIDDWFAEVGDNIKTVWNGMIDTVSEKWNGYKEDWAEGIDTMKETAAEKWKAVKNDWSGGWDKLKKNVTDFKSHWATKLQEVKTSVSEKWTSMKLNLSTGWQSLKDHVSDWKKHWTEKTSEIKTTVSTKWSEIRTDLLNGWSSITDKITSFKAAWQTGFDSVKEKAVRFKNAINDTFNDLWGDGGIKGMLNHLLDGIENAMNWITDRINALIENVNSEGITFFEHTPFEQTLFDLHIPTIPTFSIPRLATGTVVPANYGEFAAILGDNKREAEVVSPLSTMKQALREVMEEYGGNDGKTIVIKLIADGRELSQVVHKYDKKTSRVTNGGAK